MNWQYAAPKELLIIKIVKHHKNNYVRGAGEQNTEKHAVNNPDHTLHHLLSNRLIVLPQLQEIFSTRAITL